MNKHTINRISRRRFLSTAATLPWLPLTTTTKASSNVDVVIIGAGAAGLAAGQLLIDKGKSVVILEARSRIGGRAFTETETFGVPYDWGCHWLHIGRLNPWIDYGKNNGFDVYPAPDEESVYVGDRLATKKELKALKKARRSLQHAIGRAGTLERDVSVASVFKIDKPWRQVAANEIGPQSMGKDLANFSCTDWWSGTDGKDWFCNQGFGTLVAHYGRDIPVQLSTPVTRVQWDGKGVRVHSSAGVIETDAVIVTVSTGVLAADKIIFDPVLPDEKLESFQRISMGTHNNIALMFSEDVFRLGPDAYLTYQTETDRAAGLLTNISGTRLSFAYVGGSFGRELELSEKGAAVDFALQEVKKILGSDVEKKFIKGNMTRWGLDPWSLGSYASAEPGAFKFRKVLRQPVGNRIFFAGEACHRELWATCAGAYLSGKEVAAKVDRIINSA